MDYTEPSIDEVIDLVRHVSPTPTPPIHPNTAILVDIDLDSLKMLELIELLKGRFGVDFLTSPRSIRDLSTPTSIFEALLEARRQ
jgi:acyl carrier protein